MKDYEDIMRGTPVDLAPVPRSRIIESGSPLEYPRARVEESDFSPQKTIPPLTRPVEASTGQGATASRPWNPSLVDVSETGTPDIRLLLNPNSFLFSEFGFEKLEIANLLTGGDPTEFEVEDDVVVYIQGEYEMDGTTWQPIETDPYTIEVAAMSSTPTPLSANWEVEFATGGTPSVTYQKFWSVPICKIEEVESVLTITEIYTFNHLQITPVLWQGAKVILPQARK